MDILIVLLEDAGQVVTRETIRQRVWESTFVEEANITKNIGLLRSTLRAHLDDTDPIKTITKRGYQFVGPVDMRPKTESGSHIASGAYPEEVVVIPLDEESRIALEEAEPVVHAASVPVVDAPRAIPVRRVWGRRGGWIAASVILLAACTGFAVDRWRSGHAAAAKQRASLAILSLHNLSDNASENWLGAALTETLGSDLSGDNGVRLVSGERVAEAERDLTLGEARSYDDRAIQSVGRRLACDLALTGSYLPEGDRIRVDLQLRNAATGTIVTTFSRVIDKHQLIGTVAEASAKLRQSIGLAPAEAVVDYLQGTSPSEQDGVRLYLEGQRLLQEGRFQEAEPLLSQAVLLKPERALAHSALASAWQAMGYVERAREEARMGLARSGSLPAEKKLVLEAGAYAIFTDWPKAIAAYRQLTALHPDDLDYPAALAECLYKSGSPKQALQTLQTMLGSSKIAANDPRFTILEASSAAAMGDWRAQLMYAGETIRLARAHSSPYFESKGLWSEGLAWARVGDLEHALGDFHEAQQISSRIGDELGQANVLTSLGSEQGYRKDPQAVVTLRQALAIFDRLGNRGGEIGAWSELGCALTYTEDWAGAKAAFHSAIDRANEVHNPALAFGAVLDLAYVASNQDDLDAELKYANEALKISRAAGNIDGIGSSLEYLGDVAFEKGNLTEARSWYDQAMVSMKQQNSGYATGKLLYLMAQLDMATGDLASARRREDEINGMHVLKGERLEQQMLTEAALRIEEGRPEDVMGPMTDLTDHYTTALPAAEAWRLIAASYLERGDVAHARSAIEKALPMARDSENTRDYLIPETLLAARIDAAEGHGMRAEATLGELLKKAQAIQSERLQLEVRLAAGTIALEQGHRTEGERTLQRVIAEASQRGFGLTERKARKALATSAKS
ncbi:Tetratricopeptide repeat-containing protein [Granulicella pectinivorans]|uniref:Tetratricopeptide repeat-containing protein n=2 Tax=Granulicella pectinivorans TaxID=474950 RepID=A0A1I6LN99_9BACT|nr:Tetratricopeptide repeat-containing protein [Granulicella pectinivorans]